MPGKAYFIGPYDSGLVKAVKPWLLTENAFAEMNNAYVWRGRVKKRVGSRLFTQSGWGAGFEHLLSRLRIRLENGAANIVTDGTGAAAGAIPGGAANGAVGQIFSIGTAIYTIVSAVAGAQPMLETVPTTTATFDISTGNFVFAGAPINTQVYWYPSLPVMGIVNYETNNIADEQVVAFDQLYSYQRAVGGWEQFDVALTNTTWAGTDYQSFSSTNYRGTNNNDYWLFVVNNNQADGIKYWNGTQWATMSAASRATRDPAVTPNYTLHSGRIIVSFKDRLILLNTWEQVGAAAVKNFSNRARWCQNGDPVAVGGWYDNVPGKGGWIEAPTRQAIISAKILKDRLIVYFEASTWELVYTGNQVLPFIWQTIDAELGAESTHSAVLLENSVLGVGQTGIHECDGLRVARIDEKIPQEVFVVHNDNYGIERVVGIKDYFNEMVYWSFPDQEGNPTFPTRMLVYNYKNKSWSFNDDCITAFGYYQIEDDLTWGACSYTWEEFDRLWRSGANQSKNKSVLAGNQQGFTFIMDSAKNDNAPALQITGITVPGDISLHVINHNLKQNDFVDIQSVQVQITLTGGAGVGITDGAGNATGVVPGVGEVGQMFSIGNALYTVITAGVAQPMAQTVVTPTATFDTTNGAYVFAGAPATTQIYWYPVYSSISNIDGIFKVKTITDANNFTVGVGDTPVGTYIGGGVLSRVSRIDILTKQFNFYDNNRRVSINEVSFDVDRSSAGVINIGFYSSTSGTNVAQQAIANGVSLGNYTLETSAYVGDLQEADQNRLLRHVYVQSEGDCVQLQLTFDDDQMVDRNNMRSSFELNSMTFHATPTGPR